MHKLSVASAALFALGDGHRFAFLETEQDAVVAQITAQHEATVRMMREWIALPSIAAENLNYPQGPDYMAKLARDVARLEGTGVWVRVEAEAQS